MYVLYAHLPIYDDPNCDKALISEGIPYGATESAFSIPRTRKCTLRKIRIAANSRFSTHSVFYLSMGSR